MEPPPDVPTAHEPTSTRPAGARRVRIHPSAADDATVRTWLETAGDEAIATEATSRLAALGRVPGATLEVDPAPAALDRAAAASGLPLARELVAMRRDLPLGAELAGAGDAALRAFRPGVDDDAVLAVNNRAFAWHPEQAGWTPEVLHERLREPWFDPEGFLLLAAPDGTLAGFCWTKVHDEEDPPVGEIYVIAVDPDHHGRGYGRTLVVGGLEHLAGRGLRRALLWTEADNSPAVTLYRSLGFEVARRHCWYGARRSAVA